MKICIEAYHLLLGGGGINTYIKYLIENLVNIDKENEYIIFYNYFREKHCIPVFEKENVRNVVFRFPRRLFSKGFFPLELITGKFQIFHSTHFVMPISNKNVGKVLTIHDLTYLKNPDFFDDRKYNEFAYTKLLPKSIKKTDTIIAISQSTKNDIIEIFDIKDEKIFVIPFGVSDKFIPIDDKIKLQKYIHQKNIKKPYIVYPIGTIQPRKNLERVIQSFDIFLKKLNTNHTLLLVGVGNFPNVLIEKIQKLKLQDKIILSSCDSEEERCIIINNSDFVLYPSLYEGFGLPLLESMACRKTVITSNVSSLPEVAGDGAIIIDPYNIDELAENMVKLIEDKKYCEEISNKGYIRSKQFSWENTAKKTLKVYTITYKSIVEKI